MNFKHKDNVIIDGRKAYVGTVVGYALAYNEDPIVAVEQARSRRHELHWVSPHAVVISSKAYYAAEALKWAGVPELSTGDPITIEGVSFVLAKAPNDNWKLVPVSRVELSRADSSAVLAQLDEAPVAAPREALPAVDLHPAGARRTACRWTSPRPW